MAALPRIAAKRWPGCGLDAVVNCAGVVRAGGGLLSGSTAAWVEMASTNVLGAAMVTREVAQVRLSSWCPPFHLSPVAMAPAIALGAAMRVYLGGDRDG